MKFLFVVLACFAFAAADVSHLGNSDGYHYDPPHHEEVAAVPAAPAPEYLPPQHEEVAAAPAPPPPPPPAPAPEYLPPQHEEVAAEPASAELASDGYRYRTVKKLRYRYRH